MSTLSRRKFISAAAATSIAAAVIPKRVFVRSIEERNTLEDELVHVSPGSTADVIFRFYSHGKEIFTYPRTLPSETRDNVIRIGANERFVVEGFEGHTDDLGISMAAFPDQVTMLGYGYGYDASGLTIDSGCTLTIEGNRKGFLAIS